MNVLNAAHAAHSILGDEEVIARLGLDPGAASRLGLALVADADLAPDLAAELLTKHVPEIDEIERQECYTTERPLYEDGMLILSYELSEGTRRCLELLDALRVIAAAKKVDGRAA
jgi:hypothetical protein